MRTEKGWRVYTALCLPWPTRGAGLRLQAAEGADKSMLWVNVWIDSLFKGRMGWKWENERLETEKPGYT